jgi:dTDP-4-dehydrorhamnose 3,5-epimerase
LFRPRPESLRVFLQAPPELARDWLVFWHDDIHRLSHYDRSIAWNDADLGIDWPLAGAVPVLAPKDSAAPRLRAAEVFP